MRYILGTQNNSEPRSAPLAQKRQMTILSDGDLFSECLQKALQAKFIDFEITIFSRINELETSNIKSIQLVLLFCRSSFALKPTSEYIKRRFPGALVCVIIDTLDDCMPTIHELVEMETVQGVLPLDLRFDVFLAAIDLLSKGGEYFPSALLRHLEVKGVSRNMETVRKVTERAPTEERYQGEASLTTREVQILNMLCSGEQNKSIASDLNLSENTVKVHIRNIYKKMKVNNRTEAASRFFRSVSADDKAFSADISRQN